MVTPIIKVSGIGAQTAEILIENGFESAEVLAAAKEEDLLKINGFGPSKAKNFIEAAQALVGTGVEEPIVKAEVEIQTVAEAKDELETPVNKAEKSSGPKLCPQKFAKAKKKKNKGRKAKKKKNKSSRKKKSK
jgi:NAD-dependent DNA ligase